MLSEDEKEKIKRLSSEGLSVVEIARQVGRDRKTVRGVLGKTGTPHENPQGTSVPSSSSAERGELAARVFERLNRGEKPEDIVVAEKLAPDVVMGFHREWIALKNQGAVLLLEREFRKMKKEVDEWAEFFAEIHADLESLEDSVKAIGSRVAKIESSLIKWSMGNWISE